MGTPKISAKQMVLDIRDGLTDSELMHKHGLSQENFHRVMLRLVSVGALDQAELDQRWETPELENDIMWNCPACGKPQFKRVIQPR